MKTSTKIYATIMSLFALLMQVPTIQQPLMGMVDRHPAISAAVSGFGAIWALLHNPQAAQPQGQ